MSRARSRGLALFAVLQACGCAALAQKTPTPAAQIDGHALSRTPAPPNERYYLLLFGSEDRLHRPKYSHSWATLVRAIDRPGCEPTLEAHTISWLPASLDIRPLSREVELGTTLGLHDTIKYVLADREHIDMWGPYQVWHGFAYRFRVQKDFLDSGAVGYQCNDVVGEAARTGGGCDCIHAITDLDPAYARGRYPLAAYGPAATGNVVRRFMHSPIFIDPPATHDWVIGRLGLDQYPIDRRTYHGRSEPWEPGAPGLHAVAAPPLPGVPLLPKGPTPKTAPGIETKGGTPAPTPPGPGSPPPAP